MDIPYPVRYPRTINCSLYRRSDLEAPGGSKIFLGRCFYDYRLYWAIGFGSVVCFGDFTDFISNE